MARINRWTIVFLAVILAVATILRVHRLTAASLWFDERASVMSSAGHFGDWMAIPLNRVISPPDYWSVANQRRAGDAWHSPDFHPPLYAMVLRSWREAFGEGDASIRSLSVVCSLAGIVLLFDLGCTLVGPSAALWACAIMAVAQPEIQYAQEARGYALWSTLALGAAAAAARLVVRGGQWRWAAMLSICILGMLLTHFLAIVTAGALLIWCGVYLRGRALRRAIIALAVGLLGLSIIGGGLPLQALHTHSDAMWLREPAAGHVAATLWRVALIPARFLAEPRLGTEAYSVITEVIYVLPLFLWRATAGRIRVAMLLCALMLWLGVGAVAAMDLILGTAALSYIRFTLVCAPAAYLVIASLPVNSAIKYLLPLAAVVGCLMALPADYDGLWKGQWRELGADVRRVVRPGDLVVFANPPGTFLADPAKLYEGVGYYSRPIPCDVILIDRAPDADAMQRLRQASRVWIVSGETGYSLNSFLPGWHFISSGPKRLFTGAVWRAEEGS